MTLLHCRTYRLLHSRSFWGTSLLLIAVSCFLTAARQTSVFPDAALLAERLHLPLSGAPEPQTLLRLFNGLGADGYTFLVPSVLCSLLVCRDYRPAQLLPVRAAGYSSRQILWAETWMLLGLTLLLNTAIRLLHMFIFWQDYQAVCAWLGTGWLLRSLLLRGLFSVGNACFFLLLAAFAARQEIVLAPGFMLMALDTLDTALGAALRAVFPSGGIPAALSAAVPTWYIAEALALLLLAHSLPLKLPSRLRLK